MVPLIRVVKDLFIPGSVAVLLLGLLAGVLLLFAGERARRLGRRWLLALLVLYWLWATPIVGAGLIAGLAAGYRPIVDPDEVRDCQAIVVLSGGSRTFTLQGMRLHETTPSTAFRTLETARLYRMFQPGIVIVSGGMGDARVQLDPESDVMRQDLVALGVPSERIVMETASTTTREQAANLAPLLRARGADPFVLVTSPYHIRRATKLFQAMGLHPVPASAPMRSEGVPGRSQFVPHPEALLVSEIAMREYLALLYYFVRGWI